MDGCSRCLQPKCPTSVDAVHQNHILSILWIQKISQELIGSAVRDLQVSSKLVFCFQHMSFSPLKQTEQDSKTMLFFTRCHNHGQIMATDRKGVPLTRSLFYWWSSLAMENPPFTLIDGFLWCESSIVVLSLSIGWLLFLKIPLVHHRKFLTVGQRFQRVLDIGFPMFFLHRGCWGFFKRLVQIHLKRPLEAAAPSSWWTSKRRNLNKSAPWSRGLRWKPPRTFGGFLGDGVPPAASFYWTILALKDMVTWGSMRRTPDVWYFRTGLTLVFMRWSWLSQMSSVLFAGGIWEDLVQLQEIVAHNKRNLCQKGMKCAGLS